MLGDAAFLVLFADHKAGDVLQKQQRNTALASQLDKVRALLRRLGKEDAVVGQNCHRVAVQMREATHQGGAIERLEFIKGAVIHQPGDHLAHIEGLLGIGRNNAVQLLCRVTRGDGRAGIQLTLLTPVQIADATAGEGQGVLVVLGVMVRHAGRTAMHIGTAQGFGTDHLTGRGLHQRRPGEKNGRLLAHHDGFIRHGWHIGATGGTGAHHHGDLRNALRAHVGLIEKDAAKVLAIREYLILSGQVGTAGIHQINTGQAVLLRDGLRAQVLLHAEWIVRAAFHGRIVGDNHALHPLDPPDPGNHPRRWHRLAIHLMRCQLADLEKG